jgi:chemotaxis protein histidine kinase CheA
MDISSHRFLSYIDAPGGQIRFKSVSNQGTTFYIKLPQTQLKEMHAEVAEEVKLN